MSDIIVNIEQELSANDKAKLIQALFELTGEQIPLQPTPDTGGYCFLYSSQDSKEKMVMNMKIILKDFQHDCICLLST